MTENISPPDESAPPTPWKTALISLLPFVWIGPVILWLSYFPFWTDPQWRNRIWLVENIILVVVFWGGILLAVKRGFPRWSYPYVLIGIVSLAALMDIALKGLPLINFNSLWILVFIGGWTAAVVFLKPFRPFWKNIRQDWTYLSYALFTIVLQLAAAVDHDEVPQLTVVALLPSLLALAGALAHLRAKTRTWRILALVLSLTIALPIWLSPVLEGIVGSPAIWVIISFGMFFGWYIILLGILLAPALISRFKRVKPDQEILK